MVEVKIDEQNVIYLQGEAILCEAATLREKLLRLLKEHPQPAAIDIGGLSDLDTAGAQVLLALKKSVPSVVIRLCPASIEEFLKLSGLAAQLL